MIRIWNFFLKKASFTALMLVALIVAGFYSLVMIPKESAPEVQIPIGIVTTVFPGATAMDVERLVTIKIEEQLNGALDDVKEITSTSREGVSSIVVEFDAAADIGTAIQELKDEVDKVRSQLPDDANDPNVGEVDFVDQPILLLSVSSDRPTSEFITLTDELVDELKRVPGVSRVTKSGVPEREVAVIVRKEALHQYGLNISQVVGAIRAANSAVPVGSIIVDGVEYVVKFEGNLESPDEVGSIAVASTQGQPVYVRDVAFVAPSVSEIRSISRISIAGAPSEQAVSLSIFKRSGGDITRIAGAVHERLDELEDTLLADSEVLVSFDTAKFLRNDLKSLTVTGLQTVGLVMIILFIAIGWRPSLIAGLAIPLSFLVAFIGLYVSGNTINFVSLFSLILAVGILVDSAIVVTEATYAHLREGMSKREAAFATLRDYHLPLTSGTMTTVAVFAPLFFISGITGEFIASIPFTVIFVLLASLFVALAIIPLAASRFLRPSDESRMEERQERYAGRIRERYGAWLGGFLQQRRKQNIFLGILAILFFVSLSFPAVGIVKTIFFPAEDQDYLFADIELPSGTVIEETDIAARAAEEILYAQSDISSFVMTVGQGSQFGSGGSGANLANMTILLNEDRDRSSIEILEDLRRQFDDFSRGEVSFFAPQSGPPTGAPVAITFVADELADLETAAVMAERILKDVAGTAEVESSFSGDETAFVISVDRAKAAEFGLTSAQIAQELRTMIYGAEATTINTPQQDIDVQVRLDLNPDYRVPAETRIVDPDVIRRLEIQTMSGPVMLDSVVDISVGKSSGVIQHEGLDRVATVTSELREGVVAGDVVSEFERAWREAGGVENVRMQIGGENEEVDQSFREMFIALFAGILLVMTILILQFDRFRQAFLIISVVPVSLIGIMFGLAMTGKTLSFPSMMGFIALTGIVVNNAIILIDVMNRLREEGRSAAEVVVEGATMRLRPIILTTLTTVIGIIPLSYASELWAPFAFAIIFGLSFAAILTLVLVPVLYYRWAVKHWENASHA